MKIKILSLFIFSTFLFLNSCSKDENEKEETAAPVATATPQAQTIGSGTSTAIALTSSVSGTSFSWTVVQAGVTGASSGNGTSIKQTLSATAAVSGTVTYLITPSAGGTAGSAISVIITVNAGKVNYVNNIKPLITASCTPCHVVGGINSNKFDNYATAKSKITGILNRVQRESTASGFMPQGGTKLSAENIALLQKWVDDGLLEN